MKKIIIVLCLLLSSFNNSYGQWYVRKYQVSDIYLLSRQQLDESLHNSKNNVLISGVIAAMGGCIILLTEYGNLVPEDNPSFLAQLIGDNGMKSLTIGCGAVLLIGGSIATISYLGRIIRINTVINKKFPSFSSLNISPKIILNNYTESYRLGVSFTYNF